MSTPLTIALAPNSDTGLSNTDLVINQANVLLTGTGEVGDQVHVYDGQQSIGTVVVQNDGTWQLQTTLVGTQQQHRVYAFVLEGEGKTTGFLEIHYDNQAGPAPVRPQFLNDPYDYEQVIRTRETEHILTGNVEPGARVTLYDGNQLIGTFDTTGTQWQLTVTGLSDGIHQLTTITTDIAGNQSARSPALVLDVRTHVAAPLPQLDSASDTGASNSDHVTSASRPWFSGSTPDLALVSLLVNGVLVEAGGQIGIDGLWNAIPTKPLDDGAYNISVIVRDIYGNTSTSEPLKVTIDTKPPVTPTLQLTPESDAGTTSSGAHLVVGQHAVLTGTAEAGSKIALYETIYGRPPLLLGSVVADSGGNWTIDAGLLNDATHALFVTSTDQAGNASNASTSIKVATQAPQLSFESDSNNGTGVGNDNLTNVNRPLISGFSAPKAKLVMYDGEVVIGQTLADDTGHWSFTPSVKLSDGTHTVTAQATDSAGNPLPATGALIFTIDTSKPAPSTPRLIASFDAGASSTDGVTNLTSLEVEGKADPHSMITLYVDGKAIPGSFIAGDDGYWGIPAGTLSVGVHKITTTVTNLVGTVSAQSAPLTVTIDTKAPVAPAVPVLDPLSDSGTSNDRITNDTTPAITGKAEAGATVTLYDGDLAVGSGVANASGAWSITSSTLADGVHKLTAVATDVAGNASPASAALSITINTVATGVTPTALDLAAASDKGFKDNDNITNVTTPVISGKAEAGVTVVLFDGTVQIGKAVTGANGIWSITSSKLSDGVHHLSASSLDSVGNLSPASAELTVTVDTKAPTAATGFYLDPADDGGVSNSDGVINTSFPHFWAVAEVGAYVQIYDNGVAANAPALVGPTGLVGLTGVLFYVDGIHNMTVKVIDQAGNISAVSPTIVLTADYKTPVMTAPDLLAASDTGASNSDNYTANNKPTLTGKTESNIKVALYDGDTLLGTTTSDASGNWSITSDVALADGVHNLVVRGTDRAGNTSPRSPALTITIDTDGAGAAPTALDLSTASDKGVSSSDDITNLTTPVVTGKAAAGASVVLWDGATKVGTAVANSSGVWTITSAKLADGVHHLTATTSDLAGNASDASGELLVTIDTTAPVVASAPVLDAASDSGRADNDRITKVTTPKVGGTTEAGASVTLYDGATLVGNAAADANGVWSITAKALANGAHNLTVKVTDLAGNVSAASPALALTVDTTGPAAPTALDLAATADTGTSATDNITSINLPVVSGKAEANASVALFDGMALIGTVLADASGNWKFTATEPLADGVHSLTAKATDAAGNISVASAALSITIDTMVSTVAPSALDLAVASDKGVSSSDDITNLATPTITGKAAAGATVILLDGATKVGTAVANASGVWTITSSKLADGAHHLTAVTADVAGNVSPASGELLVTIDTTVPAIATAPVLDAASDSGRADNDRITKVTTPKVGGTTEAGVSVALYDGATLVGNAVADADGVWSITSKALVNGAHNLTIKVTDLAGNVSAASPALALTVDTTGPAAPTALDLAATADTGTSATDNITSINLPVVSGKAEANASVALFDGTALIGTVLADASGNWKFTATEPLADGVHSLTAKATDAAGNISVASAALSITINTAVQAAPSALDLTMASDTGNYNSDNLTNATTPIISGRATVGSTVVLLDGATKVGTAVTNANGAWILTSAKLADGEHHLTAVATDVAGNVSAASAELVVTIDTKAPTSTTAPVLTALSDSGRSNADNITNVTTPKFSGVNEAGAAIGLYDGATYVGGTIAGNDGAWTIASSALADGIHKLTVKVTDMAGNVSTASPALTLAVDTKAPVAPTTLDLLAAYDSGASATDNITAIATPAISGKAEANALVTLYDGNTLIGSAIADSSGTWKIATTEALGAGVHSLTAKATDVAGNISVASAALSLTIDPTATGLTLAGTSAADNFVLNSAAGAIKVTGFAAASDHLVLTHDYNGLPLNSASYVLALGHVVGKDYVIDLGAGHEVTLVGVTSLAAAAITLV